MLVDILFIFLFILILNPDKNKYSIIFTDNSIPVNAMLYNQNSTDIFKGCFDIKENTWGICKFPEKDVLKFVDVDTNQKAFKNISNLPNKIDIIFYNNSYQNIRNAFFQECFVNNAGKCNGADIKIYIDKKSKTSIKIN